MVMKKYQARITIELDDFVIWQEYQRAGMPNGPLHEDFIEWGWIYIKNLIEHNEPIKFNRIENMEIIYD